MDCRVFFLLCLGLIQVVTSFQSNAICFGLTDGEITEEWYNPKFQICCGERVSQRTKHLECCDDKQLYFTNKELCYNGQIETKRVCNDLSNPKCSGQICSGSELLDKKDNIFCCDGNKIELNDTQVKIKDYLGCCGKDKVYDRRSEICCDNVPFSNKNIGCCNNNIYNKIKYRCVDNKQINRTEDICGKKVYNRMEDTCCEGQLTKNIPELHFDVRKEVYAWNVQCCGSKVISKDEVCCAEREYGFQTHSIVKQDNIKCCGYGHYDTSSQICLQGIAVNISKNHAQCGNTLIDKAFQDCCSNKIPYNKTSQECCEGASYCVIEKGENCCNGFLMKRNEICCQSVKPCKKRDEEDDDCCFDYERENGQTYKRKLETCHRGQIMRIPAGHYPCGTNNYFDPEKEFCCSDKKYNQKSGQCCSGVFNNIPLGQGSCCPKDNKAYKFDDETNPCLEKCNKREKYNVANQLCCQGRIYEKTDHNYCCGAHAIDSFDMSCCGDQFPYRHMSRKKCCHHTQVYNSRYSHCNSSGKVQLKGSSENSTGLRRLCESSLMNLFDGAVQHACLLSYAITGRVTSVSYDKKAEHQDNFQVTINLKNVKFQRRHELMNFPKWTTPKGRDPKKISFVLHIPVPPNECSIEHLKKLNKVIMLFNSPIETQKINVVKINNLSSFFMTPKTFRRRFAITKAITLNTCKIFKLS